MQMCPEEDYSTVIKMLAFDNVKIRVGIEETNILYSHVLLKNVIGGQRSCHWRLKVIGGQRSYVDGDQRSVKVPLIIFSVTKAEDCYQEVCKLFPQETDKIKGNLLD